ncbi:PGA34 [Candida albicans]
MKFTKLICSSILLIIPTVMADDASSDTTIINTITITKTLYTPEESSSLLSVQLESEASAASEAAASAASIASVASEASAASLASELSALAKVTEVKADVINNYNATINSTLSSSTIAPKISSSSSSSSSKKHESITSVITSSTKDNASAAVTTKTGSATSKAGAAAMAGPVPILTNSIFTAGLLALAAVLL